MKLRRMLAEIQLVLRSICLHRVSALVYDVSIYSVESYKMIFIVEKNEQKKNNKYPKANSYSVMKTPLLQCQETNFCIL